MIGSSEGNLGEGSFLQAVPGSVVEKFTSGATRHTDVDKPDYEGFISPLVVESYGKYMHTHRKQADGTLRDSDNWQKGIPLAKYMKSLWRHFFAVWKLHRGYEVEAELIGGKWVVPSLEDCLNGILFNTMGYLHEHLKKNVLTEGGLPKATESVKQPGGEISPAPPKEESEYEEKLRKFKEELERIRREQAQRSKAVEHPWHTPSPYEPKRVQPQYPRWCDPFDDVYR